MPVEIRELVMKARVADETSSQPAEPFDPESLKHEILEQCLEVIREALENQAER